LDRRHAIRLSTRGRTGVAFPPVSTTRPLDRLSPESRAVLSLVLLQSRSYGDIAALLHLGEDDVRTRARTAAMHLVTSAEQPDENAQARIIDFLLGEQTVSERAVTRSLLEDDTVARAWAHQLVDGLAPLAKGKLPAIPEDEPEQPEGDAAAKAAPAPTIVPVRRVVTTKEPLFEPPRRLAAPPLRLLAPTFAVLVVAAVILIVVLTLGADSSTPRPALSKGTMAFTATAAAAGAGGSAVVQRQQAGLLLQLRAHGLAANTHSDSYAVWLYNSQSEALLLGFVSPPVGRSGSFANAVALPADANRFHAVIVTLETFSQPHAPGRILLRAPLALS
jgi:hypothetical protein